MHGFYELRVQQQLAADFLYIYSIASKSVITYGECLVEIQWRSPGFINITASVDKTHTLS